MFYCPNIQIFRVERKRMGAEEEGGAGEGKVSYSATAMLSCLN